MYAIKIVFLFLLFFVTSSTIHGMQVSLYCYDKPYCQGVRVRFENDNLIVPDLAQHPYYFDNRIQSCVFNGMFILYDGIYYNENNLGGGVYAEAYGDNKCVNLGDFANRASSIRVAGHHEYGWKGDSINLYQGEFYNGLESFAYEDKAFLQHDNTARSMIITGCSPWTLYEYPNFRGESDCWYPADEEKCTPAFFMTADKLKGWDNQISSVRRGCYATNKFYGEPVAIRKGHNKIDVENNGTLLNLN